MFFKHKKILFLFILLGLFLFEVDFAFALEIKNYPPVLGVTMPANPGLPDYARYFFNLGMSLAVSLAALVIIIGGIYWIVSVGRGKITHEGKEWVMAGIKGLVLLLCSYLIAVTINPKLVHPSLEGLIPILPWQTAPTTETGPTIPTITYQEIPIGTLTETTLTRTMDCYDFDFKGDPIDGNPNTPGWEPTFMDHDRVDCISKLSEAIEKKAKIFSDLSEEIAILMDTCICKEPPCSLDCTPPCQPIACDDSTLWAVGTNLMCQGDCIKSSCKGGDCCTPETRAEIEHGPILIKSCEDDPGKDYEGLDEYRTDKTTILPTMEEEIDLNGKKVKVIKKDEWEKAKLIEQLMYLREKLDKAKEGLRKDAEALKNAENKLNSCYLAKSYIDLLKIIETTKKEDVNIAKQKIYTDPVTNKPVEIAKYCLGFQYSNANCFHTCQNICSLGTSEGTFKSLKNCSSDNSGCIKDAFYQCPNIFGTFQNCITNCREKCLESCKKQSCPDDFEKCKELCDKDSDFLIKNEEKCYINFQEIKKCADNSIDIESFKKCARSALKCVYCSSQNAGYPDCLKEPLRPNELFSALYLYENPDRQKCQKCTELITSVPCAEIYPETWKCPSCSQCPKCPCIDKDCTQIEEDCLNCSSQCAEFAYNDDPLTFYCRPDWWNQGEEKNITPVGKERRCLKNQEIPIGQTVDGTEKWAEDLLSKVSNLVDKTESMLQYVKEIGDKNPSDYCHCDSKCASDPICSGDCIFNQWQEPDIDPDTGEPTGTFHWACSCDIQPCTGKPCLEMINRLRGEACPNGINYPGVDWYYQEVSYAFEELKSFILQGGRSEILKKLIYSREKIDSCSAIGAGFGSEVKLLSCKRVEHEIISPIVNGKVIIGNKTLERHCYGQEAGKILKIGSLLDNWFCCELYVK